MIKIKKFLQSVKYAWKGLKYVFKYEQNFRLQIFFAVVVLIISALVSLRKHEIIVIILLILAVLVLELLNSALEAFADIVKPRLHGQVAIVKNIMAGMVFLTSLVAMIIGIIIFWPYIFELLSY